MPPRDPDPTPAYRRFLAQLHAAGRERADGFDGSHLDGLAAHERPLVRAALLDLLRRGDTTVPSALLFLDPDAAPAALDGFVAEYAYPHAVGLSCAVALWERTRDPRYADAMLPYVRHPSAQQRLLALYQLDGAPCTAALRRAAAERVRDDEDATNRSYAAGVLLRCLGLVPPDDNPYQAQPPLMEALTSADPFRRRAALARVLDADPALREAVLAG